MFNVTAAGELAAAIRANTNVTFGLYHSLYEWFHPLYLADKNNNFTTRSFVDTKIIPEMKELVRLLSIFFLVLFRKTHF